MEVLDENEEIENMYEEMARERERDAQVIDQQREVIVRQQEEMQAILDDKERLIREKESEIAALQSKIKKRSREVYEAGMTSTAVFVGGEPKRFRLNNNCHAEHPGHGSGTSCNSAKYHKNCKGHDAQGPYET
jgi:hypothetical protein